MVRYNDWQGNAKQKCKRGFATKREAVQWEREFLRKEQLCDIKARDVIAWQNEIRELKEPEGKGAI